MNAFDASVYIERRKALKRQFKSGQIFLFGNQEASKNFKDNWYHFRQDSTVLYYTGIDQPNVHIVIDIDDDNEVLYGQELTIDDIVWTGPLPSLNEIAAQAGIESVQPLASLKSILHKEAMYLPPYRAEHNILLQHLLDLSFRQVAHQASTPLIKAVIQQRNIKEEREVEQMSLAVDYSYDMHRAVMKHAKGGLYEYDLVGEASLVACQHHVSFAYPAILTKRGEVLHNHDHTGLLRDGDMVLYDGGCESAMYYAGDITRTFPIGGKWSSLQRDMYDIVLSSYKKSVAALRPDITFKEVHLLACRELVRGLKELGFMKGDADDAVANGAHTMFFQCGLGHMIGLDVHDMENLGEPLVGYTETMKKSTEFGLKSLRLGRKLEKGYTLTVEPGIYIIPELIQLRKSQGLFKDFINYDLLEKHKGFGGIRIEDNFVIRDSGYDLLGTKSGMPITAQEVEDFMKD